MKKSILLAAFLFVLGSSTVGAKTVTTVGKPVIEAQEGEKAKYRILVYYKNFYAIMIEEEGCFTEEEAINIGEIAIGCLGGHDKAYAVIEMRGECDDF